MRFGYNSKSSITRDEGRRGRDMDMTVHLRNQTQVGGSVGEDYGGQQAKGNLAGGGTQRADLQHLVCVDFRKASLLA